MNERTYLGDGLYAEFDGYQFILAASNGIRDTNTVYLEPSVLNAFFRYVEQVKNLENTKGKEE